MNKEQIESLINGWINEKKQVFVKLTYSRDWRPDEIKTVLTLFHEHDKFDYYLWGHPLNVKTNFMEAGAIGCFLSDIHNIEPVTKEEYIEWKKQYEQFHSEVIEEKGYDFCEETFYNVMLYTENEQNN